MVEPDLSRLFRELKRRKVFRVAVVYAFVAWGVIEVAETTAPLMGLPPWVAKLVLFLALLGFPLAVVLAWALEVTPEGVKRTNSTATESAASGGLGAPAYAVVGILLTLAGLGAYVYLSGAGQSSFPTDRSIAVLPFNNLSGEADNEYFSDGITEDILTHLSRIGDLRVISRTSVMRYKETEKSLPEIADELGVAYVLEGSVRRADGRVRIVAQLIRAEDDGHIWAENYDRRLEDIFEIQSEIAREIAGELKAEISPRERERIESRPTENLAAYEAYLKGRERYFRLKGREELQRAIAYFREAIERDSAFALAHAGMADAFAVLHGAHGMGEEWLDSAIVAGTRAILLDPDVAEAYGAHAHVHWLKGHYDLAMELNLRALELNPSFALAHWGASAVHHAAGRPVEALRAAQRGRAIDPSSAWMAATLGDAYAELHADEEAERWYRRSLDLQPDFGWAHEQLIQLYLDQGDYENAEAQIHAARSHDPESASWPAAWLALYQGDFASAEPLLEAEVQSPENQWDGPALAYVYRQRGKEDQAEDLLQWAPVWKERFQTGSADRHVQHYLARIAAVRGDTEEAFRHLRAAVDAGITDHREVGNDPLLEKLRSDPRFDVLLKEMQEALDAQRARAAREGLL